jgi:membrane associated rhomboid family serine protease
MRNFQGSSYSGGSVGFGPGMVSPFIKWILISCVGVFCAQYFFPSITDLFGLTPAIFIATFPSYIFQPITYMFLHGGFLHLLFNMFALWMFGTEIEYTWGSRSFARFYFLCGLAGAALTLIVFPHQMNPMIGASGAIYGVLVAYWLMFPERELFFFPLPVAVKVKYAIPILMVINFLMSGANVAHMAHLGGALCGVLYLKLDWRWLRIGNLFKNLRYRRQEAKLEKRRQAAEDIMKRVDTILDKINEVGMENLTKAERKFLEDASSELSKQKEHNEK